MRSCHKYGLTARWSEEGFTLLEILVVMVIISIVASIAVLTINHNQTQELESTANELANFIMLTEQEAMLRPATLGLAITDHSYQVLIYHKTSHWQPLNNPPFDLHTVAKGVQLSLHSHDELSEGNPQIIISASNDVTPFVILIGKKSQPARYEVHGTASGKITWGKTHAEE